MTKRILTLALLAASYLCAGTVYLTQHGKTYHTDRTCMALSRSSHVLSADEAIAQSHGLHLCGICAHRHGGSTAKSAKNNTSFATEVK